MNAYEQLLQVSMAAFERQIMGQVDLTFERAFKALQSGAEIEIPIIGGEWPPPEYPAERAKLKSRALKALCAREWFTHEAPKWAEPLPLKLVDCHALFNGEHRNNRRSRLVGEYGIQLRGMGWDLTR